MLRRKSSWMIAICAIVGLSLLPCAAARADLLLYYNLDEGTGTTATDLSGKGNTATVGGGWTTDGMSGNAASILYSDPSSVVSTDNAIGLGSGDFSISLWFKGSFNSDWRWLVCDGPTDTGLYFATVGSGFRCSMGGWFNPDVLPTQGDGFNSTSWYNVMLVRNGTTVSAYIGGKLNSLGHEFRKYCRQSNSFWVDLRQHHRPEWCYRRHRRLESGVDGGSNQGHR